MSGKKMVGLGLSILLILAIIIVVIISLYKKPIYVVEFYTYGGSEVESVSVKAKEKVSEPEEPTKEGYEFLGWYYLGEEFDFDTKIIQNIRLEAKWEALEPESVTVTFDTLSNSEVVKITVTKGSTISDIPNPEKKGYEFLGWYYENEEFDFDTKITEDIILVAEWKKK